MTPPISEHHPISDIAFRCHYEKIQYLTNYDNTTLKGMVDYTTEAYHDMYDFYHSASEADKAMFSQLMAILVAFLDIGMIDLPVTYTVLCNFETTYNCVNDVIKNGAEVSQ